MEVRKATGKTVAFSNFRVTLLKLIYPCLDSLICGKRLSLNRSFGLNDSDSRRPEEAVETYARG